MEASRSGGSDQPGECCVRDCWSCAGHCARLVAIRLSVAAARCVAHHIGCRSAIAPERQRTAVSRGEHSCLTIEHDLATADVENHQSHPDARSRRLVGYGSDYECQTLTHVAQESPMRAATRSRLENRSMLLADDAFVSYRARRMHQLTNIRAMVGIAIACPICDSYIRAKS
jgi:hypothetical protein